MVSDTRGSYSHPTSPPAGTPAGPAAGPLAGIAASVLPGVPRESRLEGLGICTLVIGSAAIVLFFVPGLARVAWMPGLVAIVIGALDLQLKASRRRFALLGMMLGAIAFSWSFAMMLFGSAR